jgi:hypothetical protein
MAFDASTFAIQLIAENLIYDEEYHATGAVSLICMDSKQERYIAAFSPDDGAFIVEKATAWDPDPSDPSDADEAPAIDLGYALASDAEEVGRFDNPEEAARALFDFSEREDLSPTFTLLFEEDFDA